MLTVNGLNYVWRNLAVTTKSKMKIFENEVDHLEREIQSHFSARKFL